MDSKKNIKKFFNIKYVLIALIFLIVSFAWFEYLAGIILMIVFVPVTYLSVRYSKMVPHISLETNTGMACLIGYLYGPTIGFFYGLIVGLTCYLMNSFIKATYLSVPVLAGLCAVLVGVFKTIGVSFSTAFVITIILRTVIAYFWYGILGADPIERLTHQASQLLTNILLYLPLLTAILNAVAPVVFS
ncbi:hypothetical protein HN789_00585 [archaeon]|jgi:hypothetical protein|nr:hypothetical protein [archaeon]MBT4022025.1 hypothetical protein [archaeon]MBT4272638.1 hypothetical protein [archaeon]MBT4461436.1 hypothetical protein [archaeon]MBT4857794.1 hypothetical protein [archaeon]